MQKLKNKYDLITTDSPNSFLGTQLYRKFLDSFCGVDTLGNNVPDPTLSPADKYGVSKKEREPYFASNECTNSEFFQNMAETTDTDYLIYSPCTAPLVEESTYYDFINRFINGIDNGHDSLTTVNVLKHHMWLDGKPLNYNPKEAPNSQDLPDIMSINYGICIIGRDDMIKSRNIVTENPYFYKLDEIESMDIDTEFDFMVAEEIFKKINGEVK